MARSHFSFEKRRKELDKKKKKEAKRQAKADRKAAIEAGEIPPEPVVTIDEFGNVTETMPEVVAKDVEVDSDGDAVPADDDIDPA